MSAAASIVYPGQRALDDEKELMMDELVMEELACEGTIVAKVCAQSWNPRGIPLTARQLRAMEGFFFPNPKSLEDGL
jgi:hypothetical protein